MSVKARGGYHYFLTFIDDLSRYEYIYLMKHKSETFKKFKEFQSEVENHRNKNKSFYDNIAEVKYLSYEFGLQLKQCEIVSLLMMKHKSETFEKFKEFQSEVENHRNKNKSFYDMIAEVKYMSYEFGLQLKQCEIVLLLTPPGTPQCNGVSERRNRTLLDTV